MRCVQALAVLAGVVCVGGAAQADVISFTSDLMGSTEQLGAFEGTLSYNPTLAELVISITNTTPAHIGGFLTGVLFRIDSSDPGAGATLTSANVPFISTGGESGSPFGWFHAGAALGGDWLGGGSPVGGIEVGQTGVLHFAVTASDAANLTAVDFLEVASTPGPDFVARFRGLANGDSDKVPAVVPAPAGAAVLAGVGLLAARRRR
jgi:hypothetical protein